MEDVPSDSNVVDDCLRLGRVALEELNMESWFSTMRCTILSDCTTSPIVGLWLASGATQAAAIVQTRTKSSFGYFPPSLGSASSSSLSLSLRIGLVCNKYTAVGLFLNSLKSTISSIVRIYWWKILTSVHWLVVTVLIIYCCMWQVYWNLTMCIKCMKSMLKFYFLLFSK